MKAAKLYTLNNVQIEELPTPTISADEALINMKACGICGSDTMPWYVKKKAPFVLGHEPAGVVAEVGKNVTAFAPGDRVFVHHHAPCFQCKFCKRNQYTLCPVWKAAHLDPGGMAEYFRAPAINLQRDTLKLPESLSFVDGALIEPTACAVKSFRTITARTTDTMLIIGLGVMGQMHILLARHYGIGKIIAADRVPYRLEKAKGFGADMIVDVSKENLREATEEFTKGEMADIVVIGPGSISAMETGLQCVGKGGAALFFTPSSDKETLKINPFDLYFNEIDLKFTYSCGPDDTRESLRLIEKGALNADMLVTHRYNLNEIQAAVDTTVAAQDSLKTLVVRH